jgi:hypothetical protein
MRPTTARTHNIVDLNAILHPGTVFEHPRDVVAHPGLSLSEKRAILASWASDASAIASCPSLRAPEGLKARRPSTKFWRRFARWTKDHGIRQAESRVPRLRGGICELAPFVGTRHGSTFVAEIVPPRTRRAETAS